MGFLSFDNFHFYTSAAIGAVLSPGTIVGFGSLATVITFPVIRKYAAVLTMLGFLGLELGFFFLFVLFARCGCNGQYYDKDIQFVGQRADFIPKMRHMEVVYHEQTKI
jgi:hypothetical protein